MTRREASLLVFAVAGCALIVAIKAAFWIGLLWMVYSAYTRP